MKKAKATGWQRLSVADPNGASTSPAIRQSLYWISRRENDFNGSTVHIPDVLEDPEYARPVAQKLMGLRAALGVPLVRAGKTFGVISLFGTTPRLFTAKQIALLETFADQAEIAIENARLLSELRARTDDLTES